MGVLIKERLLYGFDMLVFRVETQHRYSGLRGSYAVSVNVAEERNASIFSVKQPKRILDTQDGGSCLPVDTA